jgi:transposase-like protein
MQNEMATQNVQHAFIEAELRVGGQFDCGGCFIRSSARLAVTFQEVVHSIRTGNADVAKPQRFAEDRMDTHKNARLTPKGREEMVRAVVDRGMTKAAAARQFNTTPKTVGKWVDRFLAEGVGGLRDRSSRPLSSPVQIPPATCDAMESLRRERRTQEHIAPAA